MFRFLIYFYRDIRVALNRLLLKLFYTDKQFTLGRNIQATTMPIITITGKGKLTIGENVILRENVEIRVHKNSHIEIGDNCRIDRHVRLLATNNSHIKIMNGTRIGLNTVLNGGDSITIGEKSLVSGYVYLQTSMHNYKSKGYVQDQGYSHKPITLGNDVWIGAHAAIHPGITLGDKCIVGRNSVVTKSYASNTVIAGVPAVIISHREDTL